MAIYQLYREQRLNTSLDEAWDFISSPGNLKEITPERMGFEILSDPVPGKMYQGMMIIYRIRLLFGMKSRWVTEITHLREKEYFVDEQRMGPYALWHHQHFLEPVENGVLMKDIVSYRPPFGFIGAIANAFYIKRQLRTIFDYRRKTLEKRYGGQEVK